MVGEELLVSSSSAGDAPYRLQIKITQKKAMFLKI
jgi:hypothetical protein